MSPNPFGFASSYEDVWLIDGVRTPFADYKGSLGEVSPIDLGIKVAREIFVRTKLLPEDVGAVVAGSVAQASFDAYMLPRHIGLYCGVPIAVPALLVQRVCGTGIEAIMQVADAIKLEKIALGLCVGAESMTRNPVAAYAHRNGFGLGSVEFKDFLWESLFDPAAGVSMGGTAENLASDHQITREEVDAFASDSFERASSAQRRGFLAGEIAPVRTETFTCEGYQPRGIKLPRGLDEFAADDHVRTSSADQLARIRPAFGGVQTGGNSSAVVDGSAAALVGSGHYVRSRGLAPLARIVGAAAVGVPPEIMGIGPVPAIRCVLERAGMTLDDIDRFEINEAFGAQCIAVERTLGLDHAKVNVNGGAIAIGHPLAATGIRLSVTLARELRRSKMRFGIASACIGGGQGIALLIENAEVSSDATAKVLTE